MDAIRWRLWTLLGWLEIRQARTPRLVFVLQAIRRNVVIFGHDVVIVLAVLVLFGAHDVRALPLVLPGLALFALNAAWIAPAAGLLSARFRGLPQINAALPGMDEQSTGRQNIRLRGLLLGMNDAEIAAETADIAAFTELGDYLDLPLRTYSSGMRLRLAFAIATAVDADILLLDEVIGVGAAACADAAATVCYVLVRSRPSPALMSLLLLDLGNTRLKWGVWTGARLVAAGALAQQAIESLGTELAPLGRPTAAIGCAVAGALPTARVEAQLDALGLRGQWIHSLPQQCGVRNGYTHPGMLGTDRWAALIGARARHPHDPVLIVSVGTAVTIDCLAADGRFLGGVILPGFGLMLRALEMGTAGLNVPEGELREFPNNTSDALMTGGAIGIAGAARQMHERLRRVEGRAPRVLLTGGAAPKLELALGLPHVTVEHLVFDGLLRIAEQRGLLAPA